MEFRKPTPKTAEEKLNERLATAFGLGQSAARNERFRSENPYRPSDEEVYQAWNCGYDEEDVHYVVAIAR